MLVSADQVEPSNVVAHVGVAIATQTVGDAHDTRTTRGFDDTATGATHDVPSNVSDRPAESSATQKVVVGQETETSA
jgi:hypothetical protein